MSEQQELLELARQALEKTAVYHEQEAQRLQSELAGLGPEYAPDGIVRYILRRRIAQEERRGRQARAALESPQRLTIKVMGPFKVMGP